MPLRNKSLKTCLVLLFILTTGTATAQDKKRAGQAIDVVGKAIRYLEGDATETLNKGDNFFTGDKLGPDLSATKSVLTLQFDCKRLRLKCAKTPDLKLDSGSVELVFKKNPDNVQESFLICDLSPGHYRMEGNPAPCQYVTKDGKIIKRGTVLEVDVRARYTRVFVLEGWVEIYSIGTSNDSKPQSVYAGEWVQFSEGKPIPKPQRFTMAIGPGSGSTECIYSDCKLVNSVLIPERPAVTPSVLLPPNPNPPGRR